MYRCSLKNTHVYGHKNMCLLKTKKIILGIFNTIKLKINIILNE